MDYHKGGHFEDEQGFVRSYVSRVRAFPKFVDICTKHKLTLDMVGKFSEDELIILKSRRIKIKDPITDKLKVDPETGIPIGYDDNANTIRMRKAVKAYNMLMDNTYIDIDVECLSEADNDKLLDDIRDYYVENPEIIVRLANRNVYRVFNNADITFRQGGRFYGAWWIGCPSILRKYITLEGSPTVELDYSGIHIHLAYALEGINYAALKQDPYLLEDGIPDRDLNKKILLTAINATGDTLTASSVFNELRVYSQLRKYDIKDHTIIKNKLELLKQKHKPIEDYISSGKGIFLQYYDSSVVEKLITYFTSKGIPILTIHDSVVCKSEHSTIVKDKMYELFASIINTSLRADVVKKSKSKNPLHIKYQKQYSKVPNWSSILTSNVRYKPSCRLILNEYNRTIRVSNNVIQYFLRNDDFIKIKSDTRTNVCNNRCKTSKRYISYLASKQPYNGIIKVKLVQNEDCRYLSLGN